MIVTDKKYFMEKLLVRKLDLMVERLKGTDDVVLPISGDEGVGKTNMAIGICYFISYQTGRSYGTDNIFFDLDKLIKFASETKEQIIHWDEGALGGLAIQWWKKNQQKFIQLLMIARKKKHFIVICIPKFYKLSEYIVVDRSIGLIHCYARRNIDKGRFFYYTKPKKESLYNEWRRAHRRSYKKHSVFGGSFLEYKPKIFNQEQCDEYERKKDEAILSLGNDEILAKKEQKLIEWKYRISK